MASSFAVLLLAAVMAWAQSHAESCCACDTSKPDQLDNVVCLSPQEMRAHVDHIEPLRPSGLGKDVNISGTVVLEVRFEAEGKVACARAISGHPIAIAAAMEAIRKWTFKPLTLNRAGKSSCGQITIKYRIRHGASTTKLGRTPVRSEKIDVPRDVGKRLWLWWRPRCGRQNHQLAGLPAKTAMPSPVRLLRGKDYSGAQGGRCQTAAYSPLLSSSRSSSGFSNFVYSFRNTRFTSPIGPFLCFAIISFALPFRSSRSRL